MGKAHASSVTAPAGMSCKISGVAFNTSDGWPFGSVVFVFLKDQAAQQKCSSSSIDPMERT